MDKVSLSQLISFSRYQTKCVNKFLFGEKEGKTKIHKFEYLENEKSILNKIKNIFRSF